MQPSPPPDEDALNLYCLTASYPQIKNVEQAADGRKLLVLENGVTVPYSDGTSWDLRSSMAQLYPLEPARPHAPAGLSPGRVRSYPFLEAIYGDTPQSVQTGLVSVPFMGTRIKLSMQAATAFSLAAPELRKILLDRPELKPLLKFDGSFMWRDIAGENRKSPHAYGIALDFGADRAPYWRWSKKMPHPMQQTYPGEIVRLMEDHGFIWGGKWHEYDLMHFEYRPELICKARMLKNFSDKP